MDSAALSKVLKPETDLEVFLLHQPEVVKGMRWGMPRFGHPEGAVWKHVREVLDNIERLEHLNHVDRRDLRLVTFLHDTFKYAEDKSEPRDWTKHHSILARTYAKQYVRKQRVLNLIEWHDEAYYCWRLDALHKRRSLALQRLDMLLDLFRADFDFYFRFFLCDTKTGDKNPAPIRWLMREADISPAVARGLVV